MKVWTGASTGPELDGALAKADGVEFRLPYNSDPIARERINRGEMQYFDMHLSQVAPMAWQGFLGELDVAVVEVTGITPDGLLIPSASVGNNKTWLDRAKGIILEVNSWQNAALEGMHDIYYGTALPPSRVPMASRASQARTLSLPILRELRPIVPMARSLASSIAPLPPSDVATGMDRASANFVSAADVFASSDFLQRRIESVPFGKSR